MVRTRYIGSTRAREAGFSATPKQDFAAHVSGGDWIHLATAIRTNGFPNLQLELNSIELRIANLSNAVYAATTALDGQIPVFNGSSLSIRNTPTTIDSTFGDLTFPASSYSVITKQLINIGTQAESLQVYGQDNSGGQGGDLILGSGFNFANNKYDGSIYLKASQIAFSAEIINPYITQVDSSGVPSDLFITSQGTTSNTAPSNLWLLSGVNSLGHGGDVNIYSYPGVISLKSSKLSFDKDYPANIVHEKIDAAAASNMNISAQSIPVGAVNVNGIPGDLWLNAGENLNNNETGSINLFANTGKVNVYSSNINFPSGYTPVISQESRSAVGNTFTITAQDSSSHRGGDILLTSGQGVFSGTDYLDGNVVLNSWSGFVKLISSSLQFAEGNANPSVTQEVFNTGGTGVPAQNLTIAAQANANGPGGNLLLNAGVGDSGGSLGSINLYTQTLLFNEAMPGVVIGQTGVSGTANGFYVSAQSSDHAKGGDINIYSGVGFRLEPPSYPGDDGNINIYAGYGQVNIGGTPVGGSGSVNLLGAIFFSNSIVPGTPISGAFIYASGGNLYCKGTDGVQHQLNA